VLLGLSLSGCSESNPYFSGATSETTNGITVAVVDGLHNPLPQARVTLYSKSDFAVVHRAVADNAGMAMFDSLAKQCLDGECFVEGIAGADSSLMNWGDFKPAEASAEAEDEPSQTLGTSMQGMAPLAAKIELAPSASLTLRTGASEADSINLFETLRLESTPYMAFRTGSEYVFAHVPAGLFTVVAGDSAVTTVSLEAGAEADTLVTVPGKTREFVFEDFDDGDSLNNVAAKYRNYGWYYMSEFGAVLLQPDSTGGFVSALEDETGRGKVLSAKFDLHDTGYVLLGTHLGLDTGYYDLSALTAIRMTVMGDCDFDVALEHYRDVGDNNFKKSLWRASAAGTWKEIVFRPGKEVLDESSYQVSWSEISREIGFISIFIKNGTYLKIDRIVFEGVGEDEL